MKPGNRKNLGRFLTGLTWILIVLHVAPIAWMVYCGLKDNQEILSGKVLPGRRQNDVVFLKETAAGYLAGTADGGVTLFGKRDLEKIRHIELGTFATGFLLDSGNVLWALSGNRGLQKVDAEALKLRKIYGIAAMAEAYGSAWSTLWVNEVAGSTLDRSGGSLYLSFRFKGYPGVTVFDIASETFRPMAGFSAKSSGTIKLVTRLPSADMPGDGFPGNLALLTGQGLFTHRLQSDSGFNPAETGPAGSNPARDAMRVAPRAADLPAVPDRLCALDSRLMLMSADSRAFVFDLAADSVVAWLDRKPGSGNISAFALGAGRIWLGDSRGVTALPIPNIVPDTARSAASLEFAPSFPALPGDIIAGGKAGDVGDITARRITAILPLASGGVLLGGPGGALSLLDVSGKALAATFAPTPSIYIHWRNYVDLWRNIDFGLYLKNSFIVCVGVMLVAMVLASMGGYALARYNFPGKNLFGYSVLATQMVPGIMLLLPLYLMFINFSRATGLVIKGSYGGLILTYAAYFVPFSIWILRGFFASLPKELEEAALVDGCGPIQAFFRIIIPSALPGIIATGVYVFLSAWDELMFAWVLTDERTYTIPVGIRLFVGNFQNRYDLMMAAATVSTIPVMILFFLMQKHIVSGLTAGAVKE
jgi:multiple sugar transport system permease protein